MAINTIKINLKEITTFGLPADVTIFEITDGQQIAEYFNTHINEPYFVLGGGSNIIYSPEIKNKNILKIEIPSIQILEDDGHSVLVKVGAGVVWDEVVGWSINNNLSGIEALSAIPGKVGAAPVQNIGAYGCEIKDVLKSLTAYDTIENKFVDIKNQECGFSYRQSIFKSTQKNRYIIVSVVLKLSHDLPKIPDYPAVVEYFKDNNIANPTSKEIRKLIKEIRWSKLPHPEEMGNCGSFFENPIVDINFANDLKKENPDMPFYDLNNGLAKIPAGYLIESVGLKGANFGKVGTYEKNALVLVNLGNAEYVDVIDAKNKIINAVKDRFNIELKNEPEIIG
jgi:UDP-N-acetylmuramate dehydrogenase